MTWNRTRPLLFASLMAGALCSGCSQKKPVVAVPQTPAAAVPQAEAQPSPTEAQPQTQPAQATPRQGTPPPEPQPEPQPVQPQPATPAADKTSSTKAKTTNPHPNGKKTAETARNRSAKTTVPSEEEPLPATGQISPSLSNAEIARNQTTTEQLLQSAEATLSGIKRQLSDEEQAIAVRVHDYINQSRQATRANDLTRAYNLAVKARLLSDDLAKQR